MIFEELSIIYILFVLNSPMQLKQYVTYYLLKITDVMSVQIKEAQPGKTRYTIP